MKHIPLLSILVTGFFLFAAFTDGRAQSNVPRRAGWWNFNNTANLLQPAEGFGQPLALHGSHRLAEGPSAADNAVKIGAGSYYTMRHQMAPNGGGTMVNEYSLQIDFRVESFSGWHCFFQTNSANSNDGDCFINPSGFIGVATTGYSPVSIAAGEWYRLVITVENGKMYKYYIDGYLLFEGIVQPVDGRFSLGSELLLFADDNGEDQDIIVSEIGIWNQALTEEEVFETGGFGHIFEALPYNFFHPFLQSLTSNSVSISWHDPNPDITRVEYGPTPDLGTAVEGTSELLAPMYRWHTVKLSGLEQGSKYYYRINSGAGTSEAFDFNTQPGPDFKGHIRFLLFSDTQDDSATTGKIVRKAKLKVQELYGNNIADHINLVMHTGDITGNGSVNSYWPNQLMRPFAPLSASLPFLSVAGNHEMEDKNYYTYVKYDDISAFPPSHALFEKVWSYRLPGILMAGLNTSVADNFGAAQINWLDKTLRDAENDTSIDFVFCFMHHPPWSELWGEGNTAFVSNDVLTVLKKYSKVTQLSYGHTHAYERGVIESVAENSLGDFRISCVGGGGGARDRWGVYTNFNYPQIHTAIDHHFFVLYDIDLGSKSFTGTMFDLGNADVAADNVIADTWHRRLNQAAPSRPEMKTPTNDAQGNKVLHASAFDGSDEIMSSQFQITQEKGNYSQPMVSVIRNWTDIYGVDASFRPVDLNKGIDLTSYNTAKDSLKAGSYYCRVRYRDQNLRWSDWSDEMTVNVSGPLGAPGYGSASPKNLIISPNPANLAAELEYTLPRNSTFELSVFDSTGRKVHTAASGFRFKGTYRTAICLSQLAPGTYTCVVKAKSYRDSAVLIIAR